MQFAMVGYLLFTALLLIPSALAAGMFYVMFRAAWRRKSPGRILILYPVIGSVLFCVAFLVWMQIEWFRVGPTAKSLAIVVVPIYLVGVAIAGFVASWSLVYAVRFGIEKIWKVEPKITCLAGFVPAAFLLGLMIWATQASVRRSVQLSAASSETASPESRERQIGQAIAQHDVDVLSLLARNPQTSSGDLSRIYAVCKRTFNSKSSSDYEVFYSLAQNPHTPVKILSVLATAEETSTRIAVASNSKAPEASLYRLAGDDDDLVRCYVTGNPRVPFELLQHLSQDRDEVTRNHANSALATRIGIK